MCRLVQPVQHQPAASIGYSRCKTTGGVITLHKVLKRTGQITAQAVGLKKLPIVKAGTIAQAKARQKIILIQRQRLAERLQAGRTRLGCRVIMRPARGKVAPELMYIHPDTGVEIKADVLPVNFQPCSGKGFIESRKSAA